MDTESQLLPKILIIVVLAIAAVIAFIPKVSLKAEKILRQFGKATSVAFDGLFGLIAGIAYLLFSVGLSLLVLYGLVTIIKWMWVNAPV